MITDTRPAPTITDRCGARRGYDAHQRRGERPCQPCLDANRAYRREWRPRTCHPSPSAPTPPDAPAAARLPGYSRPPPCGRARVPALQGRSCPSKQIDYYHHGGGAEVQRRRRQTATSQRLDREAGQRETPPDEDRQAHPVVVATPTGGSVSRRRRA